VTRGFLLAGRAGEWLAQRRRDAKGCGEEEARGGTGIRWLGYRFDDAGRAEARIDGKVVAVVDQYDPGRGLSFDWKIDGLSRGRHTIEITLLPEHSPASKDRFINIAGFEIL